MKFAFAALNWSHYVRLSNFFSSTSYNFSHERFFSAPCLLRLGLLASSSCPVLAFSNFKWLLRYLNNPFRQLFAI